MVFIDTTSVIYPVYTGLIDITGSVFLTLLMIVILFVLVSFIFRIPSEFTAIFILPMLLSILAYESEFMAVGGVILIYLGYLLGKNILVSR